MSGQQGATLRKQQGGSPVLGGRLYGWLSRLAVYTMPDVVVLLSSAREQWINEMLAKAPAVPDHVASRIAVALSKVETTGADVEVAA